MDSKKGSSNSTGKEKRQVVSTTIGLRKEIVAKFENGVPASDLATHYNMAQSTISTLLTIKKEQGQLMPMKEWRQKNNYPVILWKGSPP